MATGRLVLNKQKHSAIEKHASHTKATWQRNISLFEARYSFVERSERSCRLFSQVSASHFKRYRKSDKSGAVFRSIDGLAACFCYLCSKTAAMRTIFLWCSLCQSTGKKLDLLCQWTLKKRLAGATSEPIPSCPSCACDWEHLDVAVLP